MGGRVRSVCCYSYRMAGTNIMSYLNLSVILFTVFLSAIAQLLLKIGVEKAGPDPISGGVIGIVNLLFTLPIFLGITIYGSSVLIWLWVLSRVELSLAYPFVGLSFIFTLAFGFFILDESVNTTRVLGTLLIATGCIFVAKS